MTKNPYINPENPFEQYNESIKALRNDPKIIEMDKLCYEVFSSESGKHLLELFKTRYLIPALAHRNDPSYPTTCVFVEGFREGFRLLLSCVESHAQRIKAETNPA